MAALARLGGRIEESVPGAKVTMRWSQGFACLVSLWAGGAIARAQVDWTTPGWVVQARDATAIASDTARGRLVLFGGASGSNVYDDTWEWDGSTWTEVFPATRPPARAGHDMTYDASRGVVVLFGGSTAAFGALNDTWEWDGTDWTQRLSATVPPAAPMSLTYDASRSVVVGFNSLGFGSGQIWEWNGSDWRSRSGAYAGVDIAYDALRMQSVVAEWQYDLFTGRSYSYIALWNGTFLKTVGTQAMTALVEDPAHGYVLGAISGNTCAWDGTQWIEVGPPFPSIGFSIFSLLSIGTPRFAFDVTRQRPVGIGDGVTFEWDGSAWVRRLPLSTPPPAGGQSLAYDRDRDRIVHWGQGTWLWDGAAWTHEQPAVEPPVRSGGAIAYVDAQHVVLLFGGLSGYPTSGVADTWLWDGTIWTPVFPPQSPPARYQHTLAYDSGRQRVVLFGGSASYYNDLDDTWEWDGVTWMQRLPATRPAARSAHALAYDARRGRTVMFGGRSGSNDLADTWEWDGNDWEQKLPVHSPSMRYGMGMAYDEARGCVVLVGGYGSYYQGYTWEWDGVDWTERTTAHEPVQNSSGSLVYDTARRRITMLGAQQDMWFYGPTDPATFTTSHAGCPGSAGTPALAITTPSGYPWLGEPFSIAVTNAAPGHAVSMAVGLSSTSWGGESLPFSLERFGMLGCQALCSAEIYVPLGPADPSGTATWTFGPLPADPGYSGFTFFAQAWIADSVNPAGLITSNLGKAVVGGK